MAGWDSFVPDDAPAAPTKAPAAAGTTWASFVPDDKPASAAPGSRWDRLSPEDAGLKRKAVEGGGTDTADPLVENVAIGVGTLGVGTAMGVGADTLAPKILMGYVPKTAAGKALTAAGLTAEQYLYGWLGEKGAEAGGAVAGTPGAVVGGIAAPMLGGAAIEGGPSIPSKLSRLPKATESAARAGASAAESKLYEEAPKDIQAFGEKTEAASTKAAEARTAAKQAASDKAKAVEAQVSARLQAAKKEISDQAAPQLAQQAEEQFFGRTRQESAQARTMPIEDLALHRANMRNVVFGPINRTSDQLGKQFEVATAGRLTEPIHNLDAIETVSADEGKWLGTHGAELSKPVRDLRKVLPGGEVAPEVIQSVLDGKAPPAVNVRFNNAVDFATEKLGRGPNPDELRKMARQALRSPSEIPTVGQLLGWRSEASRLVASQSDHNQVVAMRLREGIDQTLMDNGIQIPKELREKWATYKSMFDHNFRRNVATAVNPVGYGRKLFENPERALSIIRGATPDEKNSLKQLMADYVRSSSSADPFKMGKRITPAVMEELFGETPYAKFRPWLESDHKALAWEHYSAGNPQIAPLINTGARTELRTIAVDRAKDVVKAGRQLAEALGPAGRGKLAKILSTRDPEAQARIVEQEFPIDPQNAQALYQQAQITPGKAAFQKSLQSKRILGGLDINAQREEGALKALMGDPRSNTMANLKRRLFAWHLPMLLGGMIGAGAGGRMGGGYQLGISGMILGMMAGNKIRNMFRVAITDPDSARDYWRAIDSTPSGLNAKKFGAMMARIAVTAAPGAARGFTQEPQSDESDDNQ